jgi:hypothetical protein
MPADPIVESRLLLGTLLRQARVTARISAATAAAAISGSSSKISRLESGQVPARRNDVETLIGLYGLPLAEHGNLLRLAGESGGPSWWEQDTAAGISSEQVRDDLLLESAAELISVYDPQCFTGLLQCPAYLNALCAGASWPCRTGLDIKTLRRRAQLMSAGGAPHVWGIFSASVLERAPNGDMMALREQIQYLESLVNLGALKLQFIADNSSAHMSAGSQFEILRFRPAALADMVLLEFLDGIRTVRGLRVGEGYRLAFSLLAVSAYSPAQSAEMLAAAGRAGQAGG